MKKLIKDAIPTKEDMKNLQITAIKVELNQSPPEYTLEQLMEEREKAVTLKEEMESAIKVINDELLARLKTMGVNGTVILNKTISKVTRVSFTTSLAEAKEYGAIKTVIDSDILKKLWNKGVKINGVKVSEFVMIREIERKEE